jgi:hypothetical protein
MDKVTIGTRAAAVAAESLYRSVLTLVALMTGFKAFPDAQFFVASVILMMSSGVRAIKLNQDITELKGRRLVWTEDLTVRIALVDLHNDAIAGRKAEAGRDGHMPVWEMARNAALDDLRKYDVDEGGLAAVNGRPRWLRAVFHLVVTMLLDVVLVGLAYLATR